MNARRRVVAAAALAALLLPNSMPAQAQLRQTPGSQITVTECNPHRHTAAQAHPWIDPYGIWHSTGFPYYEGFLAITYTNNAQVAAKEVDFGLVVRHTLIAVTTDVGTFSPGAQIAHEFEVSPEIFPIGTSFPYCAVLRVKYSDGTEWHNPRPPQEG